MNRLFKKFIAAIILTAPALFAMDPYMQIEICKASLTANSVKNTNLAKTIANNPELGLLNNSYHMVWIRGFDGAFDWSYLFDLEEANQAHEGSDLGKAKFSINQYFANDSTHQLLRFADCKTLHTSSNYSEFDDKWQTIGDYYEEQAEKFRYNLKDSGSEHIAKAALKKANLQYPSEWENINKNALWLLEVEQNLRASSKINSQYPSAKSEYPSIKNSSTTSAPSFVVPKSQAHAKFDAAQYPQNIQIRYIPLKSSALGARVNGYLEKNKIAIPLVNQTLAQNHHFWIEAVFPHSVKILSFEATLSDVQAAGFIGAAKATVSRESQYAPEYAHDARAFVIYEATNEQTCKDALTIWKNIETYLISMPFYNIVNADGGINCMEAVKESINYAQQLHPYPRFNYFEFSHFNNDADTFNPIVNIALLAGGILSIGQ